MGAIHFTRQDGIGTVTICSHLSEVAAEKLESYLRELLAEDAPRLALLQKVQASDSQAMQEHALRQLFGGGDVLGVALTNKPDFN